MNMSPAYPDLRSAAIAVRAGEVRPIELVDACLSRIDQLDGRLSAWVHVDPATAREAARETGRMLDAGQWLGALHGLPIGVKDIIDVAGMPTRAGSPLTDPALTVGDAPIVAQFRQAGAIILGKTVTTEFACFDPASTLNPLDESRTPGGSSSGSAVAVATGMCFAALGSQTGGSIIRPASYCGVAGLKPTLGVWNTDGVVPVSFHLDHVGPIAPTAADLQLVRSAVCQPGSAQLAASAELPRHAPTLVVPRSCFLGRADPALLSIVDHAVTQLQRAGAQVEQVDPPPGFERVLAMHRRIMAVELAEYHRHAHRVNAAQYAPGVASLIEEGLATHVLDYAEALKARWLFRAWLRAWFSPRPDVIWLTPATTSVAPGRETTGDPSFNSPWSYAGVPAVSFPCGLLDGHLPVGLQLIAGTGRDRELLAAACWCEHVVGEVGDARGFHGE